MKKQPYFLIVIGIFAAILLLSGSSMFIKLNPGERGVVFKVLSRELDKDNIRSEGLHIVAPWNEMYIYDVRRQTREEKMNVLAKNGLSVNIDVTLIYYPDPERIGYLHELVGKEYVSKVVIPPLRSAVRQVAGRYTAEEIYSTKRTLVSKAIKDETKVILKANNIEMSELLIRSINLPKQITMAIENKLTQQQEALAYQFKLEKEKSEAERKRIAAEGEAKANKIINSSLTPALLKMRGIEATIKLSESSNSKVVVIGSGKDGLPLILGNN